MFAAEVLCEHDVEKGLSLAVRVHPKYQPVFDKMSEEDRAAVALYFLPHGSKKDVLEVTRPKVVKWYCPFADQREFPSGHRYSVNVYTGCEHKCQYCYVNGYSARQPGCKSRFREDLRIHPPGPWRCGFIYDETREAGVWLWPGVGSPGNIKPDDAPQGWKWHHADGKDVWNDVAILCRGTRIKSVINGVTIADYNGAGRLDDEAHRRHNVGMKGHIGLQIHPGDDLLIRFKDITVRKLE